MGLTDARPLQGRTIESSIEPRPEGLGWRNGPGGADVRKPPALKGPCVCYSHLIASIVGAFLGVSSAFAADERAELALAERLIAAELPKWTVSVGGTTLAQPKEPALRWTNPAIGRVYGNTYLWLHEGRPAAACSFFRYFEPYQTLDGEIVALAATTLVARRNGNEHWRPAAAWAWKDIPNAPKPAASAALRLVQLRALAKEFSVELLDTRNNAKGDEQLPRLLPQPLFRYDPAATKKLDGAVFAFVVGTDPEALLLLETDTAAAAPTWKFGFARMNHDALRVVRKDMVMWEEAKVSGDRPDAAYMYLRPTPQAAILPATPILPPKPGAKVQAEAGK